MKAAVSLWSADLLDVGAALDRLTGVADAFHVDVMDGHEVPVLLFGPDFVKAVRKRTRGVVDVHLIVSEADRWVKPFAEAGADVLTVYPQSCPDLRGTLEEIRRLGVGPGVSVDLSYPFERVRDAVLGLADRVVIMGTETGVKGSGWNRRPSSASGRWCVGAGSAGAPRSTWTGASGATRCPR